ncbi:MAG TPA: alcohol dehydrogenase catalytic domain-containing protein [Niabella sp.]|nr:alcohol dehydrogenase catalytic domain-containing protein [Niabella sp.]
MKAAVYEGKEQLIVRDIDIPSLEEGEILLEIEACCVCGTDMRTYRHGDKKIIPPRVLGHEFCGRIIENKATGSCNLKIGDRVVMYIVLACGKCRYCTMGRQNLCISRTTMSYHHDGAFARYMKVPAKAVKEGNLIKVDNEDISSAHLSLSEPLGCVMNSANRLKIGFQDTVAIIGAGPIGVMHAILARLAGAQKVWMLDISENRLKMMEQFDIDGVVKVTPDSSHIQEVEALTNGFGASVVVVANSVAQSQADALEIAGKGARVEFFGGLPKSKPEALLNTNHLHYKELLLSGSYSEKMSDFQSAYALINSGRFPAGKIITHTLPLDRVTEAFTLMETGESLKVCIIPE